MAKTAHPRAAPVRAAARREQPLLRRVEDGRSRATSQAGARGRLADPVALPIITVAGSQADPTGRHDLTAQQQCVWSAIRPIIVCCHHLVARSCGTPAAYRRARPANTIFRQQPERRSCSAIAARAGKRPSVALDIRVAHDCLDSAAFTGNVSVNRPPWVGS